MTSHCISSHAERRLSPSPALQRQGDFAPAAREPLDMGALLRFKSMMAGLGESVQVPRMCFDRLYAYERIAQAHACGPDALRRLALELFQAYHRRDANDDPLVA